ncbi:MAG: hypothetical protein GC151_09200 [Betaproteobacteria bacterium]|nr:hypothetical protein [Betaproteobacteria bacterium]
MDVVTQRAHLDRLVASGRLVVIDVAVPDDPRSAAFSAVVDALEAEFPAAVFARLDAVAAGDVADLFGLRNEPGLIVFRAGVGLYAGPAPGGTTELARLLERAGALDMDAVRREMDRERTGMPLEAQVRACPMSRRGIPPT